MSAGRSARSGAAAAAVAAALTLVAADGPAASAGRPLVPHAELSAVERPAWRAHERRAPFAIVEVRPRESTAFAIVRVPRPRDDFAIPRVGPLVPPPHRSPR
jgi:hypothetical protein